MGSIFSRLFGTNEKAGETETPIFPGESFSVIEGQLVDGRPFVGSFNMSYKNYRSKASYPWCLKLAIGLDEENLYDNGLPLDDESYVANRMEDRLVEKIKTLGTAHYLGHVFNDSFLDIYIQLGDPEPIHEHLQGLIASENHERGFGYEIKNHPEWRLVQEWASI